MLFCKKFLVVFLSLFFAFIFTFASFAALLSANVETTDCGFSISSNGIASVYVDYQGFEGYTSGALIDVSIKKRVFLVFWSEVETYSWNISLSSFSDVVNFDLSIYGSNTYKCEVQFTISGSGGADDIIPYEFTDSF